VATGGVSTVRRIARLVPRPVRVAALDALNHVRSWQAARAWAAATPARAYLGADELARLAARYPDTPDDYHYDPDALRTRGRARAALLARETGTGSRCLEIGSADAMTACALQEAGRRVTAVDIDTSRTDPRARAAGVDVREMDATQLVFEDGAFDFVYSFNAFEHLPDPAATFAELARVIRPGGRCFVSFTGLRWSPQGAHMYKVIGIPYITVLFDRATIDAYLASRGRPTDFPWVNEYGIEQFRAVLHGRPEMAVLRYHEARNRWHTPLVRRYPAQFRRAPSYDSLLVDTVTALFEKRAPGADGRGR
jgi:SAM-dependent methyltransferase